MKLHLMASFRTHFNLRDEEVNVSPSGYVVFWRRISEAMANHEQPFSTVHYLHKTDSQDSQLSRFRSVDKDSLLRPLHVVDLQIDSENPLVPAAWHEAMKKFPEYQNMLDKIVLINDSVSVRLYNNSVALLQVDLDITELVKEQKKMDVANQLDILQEAGITFGEYLSRSLYRNQIQPYLVKLIQQDVQASRFINTDNFTYKTAKANAILTHESTEDNQSIVVNWVTRTLLVEAKSENNLKTIIDHWLKDCGDQTTIDTVRHDPDACAIRWLNYLFRENAYAWPKNRQGEVEYSQPFCDEWQAMLNAQYYYAAFEALNDSLRATLSIAYQNINKNGYKTIGALRKLNRKLETDIIAANLAIVEYHNNYGYYNRNVGSVMKEIMKGWDFEEAILSQVKHNISLCEQRISELHQKAASRSDFYSDIILLWIAVTSVVAFLFQLIEYGRNMSNNANMAIYESNSWNLVEFISERPTDFIILLSLGIIILLFFLYSWFRRAKVMD